MDDVTLTPDLAKFATEAVAAGHYRDVGEVVHTGVSLVRRLEGERDAFIATLEAAHAEGRRDGFLTIDQVAAELDEIIAEAERGDA
jgi:putative addiction module CopG family antidote